ncbi:hypothetical protein ACIRQP_27595 [Streptomyces sp. NPDC102274]|uniref:hypothetical protein n=1 Tax=Streptomyces sp. NPDC102274 TaxID=3366151 RepID=UPI0037F5068A
MDQRGDVLAVERHAPFDGSVQIELRDLLAPGWSVVGTMTGKGLTFTVKAAPYPVTLNER